MQFKREIKILAIFVTMAYAVWANAQPQPQANGYGYGPGTGAGSVSATRTTTNSVSSDSSIMQETAPSDVSTVNPMDPVNDSRRANDSSMLDMRRQGRANLPTSSGTTEAQPSY